MLVRTPMIVALVTFLAVGCFGDEEECSSQVTEATYDCFEGGGMPEGAIREGLIEIGTGQRDFFEPVVPEQDLQLIAGLQGGFHFEIRTHIQGIDGGKPGSTDANENARTLLSAYNEGGERIDGNLCGFTIAYEAGEEYNELPGVRLILFDFLTRPAFGERVRIVAEIVDQCGRYASDEVWVVVAE
jgi:hypothetical protein